MLQLQLHNHIKNRYRTTFRNSRKNGDQYDVSATVSPILDDNNNLLGFMGIEEDITETKNTRDELKKLTDLMIDKHLESKNG